MEGFRGRACCEEFIDETAADGESETTFRRRGAALVVSELLLGAEILIGVPVCAGHEHISAIRCGRREDHDFVQNGICVFAGSGRLFRKRRTSGWRR